MHVKILTYLFYPLQVLIGCSKQKISLYQQQIDTEDQLSPIANLRVVAYARTTESNKRMSKCNENIQIRLRMLSQPPQ